MVNEEVIIQALKIKGGADDPLKTFTKEEIAGYLNGGHVKRGICLHIGSFCFTLVPTVYRHRREILTSLLPIGLDLCYA